MNLVLALLAWLTHVAAQQDRLHFLPLTLMSTTLLLGEQKLVARGGRIDERGLGVVNSLEMTRHLLDHELRKVQQRLRR